MGSDRPMDLDHDLDEEDCEPLSEAQTAADLAEIDLALRLEQIDEQIAEAETDLHG